MRPSEFRDPVAMVNFFDRLKTTYPFPDPATADSSGLIAYGGDLAPERLLSAYAHGVFPWYESGPILWFDPEPRFVLRLEDLHVSRSLAKVLRHPLFALELDIGFERVIRGCAETPRPGQSGTWITPDMIEAYCRLHDLGFAHCVSVWEAGELVGGIYGISLGAGFFGESMFSRRPNASKVAFVHLVRQLLEWRFHFLDCQVRNEHLASLGAGEWCRSDFHEALDRALGEPTRRGRWRWSRSPGVEA